MEKYKDTTRSDFWWVASVSLNIQTKDAGFQGKHHMNTGLRVLKNLNFCSASANGCENSEI